jgi:dCTP deaminase
MGDAAVAKHSEAALAQQYETRLDGVLPMQELKAAFKAGMLSAEKPPMEGPKGQFQPASLDTRVGERVVCVRSAFLPEKGESIERAIEQHKRYEFELSDDQTNVLECRKTYVIPFFESAALRSGYSGEFNPKSTLGRVDALTRVLVQDVPNFDTVLPGKNRKMWLEITPLSHDLGIKLGTPVSQLRVKNGTSKVPEEELRNIYKKTPLLYDPEGKPVPLNKVRFKNDGIELTADAEAPVVAYRSRQNSQLVFDVSLPRGALYKDRFKFFEPIERQGRSIYIEPDPAFYLLATLERVHVPPNLCGTLMAYDVTSLEGRVHYAGFFDPGFAASGTLEVRAYHRPFRVVHRQPICVINFEYMRSPPIGEDGKLVLYGKTLGNNYQNQPRGPNLPKQCQPV